LLGGGGWASAHFYDARGRVAILAPWGWSGKRRRAKERAVGAVTKYEKREDIMSCRITKPDLIRLARLMTEHATGSTADINIQTHIGDLTIQAETLDDFLAHTELPPILTELTMWAQTSTRSISIRLAAMFSSFEVHGEDDVWVRGSHDRLRAFFVQHRRFEAPHQLKSSLLVSVAAGAVLTLVAQLLVQQQLVYGFIASVAGCFLLLLYTSS
jgi:hypothetical protein